MGMSPWHNTALCRDSRGTSGAAGTISGSCEVMSIQSSCTGWLYPWELGPNIIQQVNACKIIYTV